MLALHYWAGAGRAFDALRPVLPGVKLLAPDLPGFGAQGAPAGFGYAVRDYADWVASYIQQQRLTDFTLLGHSMGGKIALALAARRPSGLRRLVLLAPSPPTCEPMSDEDRSAALLAFGLTPAAEKTYRNITQQPLTHALHAAVVADNLRCSHAAWDAWLRAGSREDIAASLAQLAVPCALLAGAADRAITPATQLRDTLPYLPPGTPYTLVPGAGHLLPLEAPAAVAAAVRNEK